MFTNGFAEASPAPPQRIDVGDPIYVPANDAPKLELVQLFAACIEPKLGGPLMRALTAVAPLDGLSHIKRVRKSAEHPAQLEILLCQVVGGSNSNGAAGEAAPQAAIGSPLTIDCLPAAIRNAFAGQSLQRLFIAEVRAASIILQGSLTCASHGFRHSQACSLSLNPAT